MSALAARLRPSAVRAFAAGRRRRLADHYARVDLVTASRMGILISIAATVLGLAVTPLAPPERIGGVTGWVLVFAFGSAAIVTSLVLRGRLFSGNELYGLAFVGSAQLVGLQWLTESSVYQALLLLAIAFAALVHPASRFWLYLASVLAGLAFVRTLNGWQSQDAALLLIAGVVWTAIGAAGLTFAERMRVAREGQQLATHEARSETDVLRELDEMKDEFLSSLSHELRTPLTSIKGFMELMLDDAEEPLSSGQREHAEVVARNAKRLDSLVSDLLTLSHTEAGRLVLASEPVELESELRFLVQDRALAARDVDVEVRFEAAPGLRVLGDPERLGQAVANLLSNAIKFSRAGGVVYIRSFARGKDAMIEVADSGLGIPPYEIERLGERFFRAGTAAGVEGTGIGLALARELVERQDGRLEIESALDEGSTFRIVLPLLTAPR